MDQNQSDTTVSATFPYRYDDRTSEFASVVFRLRKFVDNIDREPLTRNLSELHYRREREEKSEVRI